MPSLESNVSSKIFYASIRSHIRFIPRITADLINMMKCYCTKMKFPVKDFFSKYDQIRSFLLIWPHLLKKSLMENFIFCAVPITHAMQKSNLFNNENESLVFNMFYILYIAHLQTSF